MLAGIQGLEPKVRGLITKCPEGKIANLCKKLGFKEIKRVGVNLYFILNLNYK
jgi:hypothetical protein